MTQSRINARWSIALVATLGLSPTLWAINDSTWKWLDADGNITYGDLPPNGVEAQRIRVSTGTVTRQPDSTSATTNASATSTSNDTQLSAAQQITPEQEHALCEQAKFNLEVLNSSARIRQTDETGESRFLNESEKQAQTQTARDIMKSHCH